ncbi:hypothetical protein [Streptomyces zaomyceticus]|uniref:hypothetical protein n=1 Tax=Streptomyces zaomyceticus TaxID=68286 RepID=UPI002E1FC45A
MLPQLELLGDFQYPTAPFTKPSSDDRALNRALRALRPPRAEILVDRVHLVSQRQDPERGYYTWDVVQEYLFTDTEG